MFESCKRPVLILGWGIHLAGAEKEAIAFAERTGIPVCLTWGAADLLPHDHPLRIGTFGTHGNKFSNLAIQNADFVVSVGSRLDTKATGFPVSSFAPNAKLVMCDIDHAEIDKFKELGRHVEGFCCDAKRFFGLGVRKGIGYRPEWLSQIEEWKKRFPAVNREWRTEPGINPYAFVEKLSDYLDPDDVIVSDTGCPLAWMMQAFKFKGQRFLHAFNNTPMGYGLPAATGAALASGRRTILVTGDGGLSVNITEMATIARHVLPIKIILFNNRGHAMCRQTQRQWLGGDYPSTSYEGGLATPNFTDIAEAYGITAWHHIEPVSLTLPAMLKWKGPTLYELPISERYGVEGQIKFGEPLAEAA